MHLFNYKSGELYAEDVAVKDIVAKFGTPVFIYSYNTLLRHFKAYKDAFGSFPPPYLLCD